MTRNSKPSKFVLSRFFAFAVVCLLIGAGAHGQAYLTQSINTTSLNYASYGQLSGGAGPYPFSNFGVQATDTLGLSVSASTSGATSFTFPTFTSGEVIPVNSTFNYAYNSQWTGGSIGSNAGLSANASFNYNLGPFSGTSNIYDAALNTSANGVLTGGTGLFAGSGNANGVATGPTQNFGLTESAILASASVGLNVGLNLQTALKYSTAVQYGYYTWVNTTGAYSPTDAVTWHGVSSGPLSLNFANTLPNQTGTSTFFVNYAPGVQVDIPITPTSTVQVPVSGYLNVSAFGDTIVNTTVPIGTITAYTANYDTWDDAMNFNGKYYSLELTAGSNCGASYTAVQLQGCEHYTVDGSGPLLGQAFNPPGGGGSSNSLTGGGGTGTFDGNFGNAPLLPSFCDPSTGMCYASNDPNAPIGPGTVTTTDTTVQTPEPAVLYLLAGGSAVLLLGMAGRRKVLMAA